MHRCLKVLRTYALAWILLLAGFAVTAAIGFALFRSAYETDRTRFERQVAQTAAIIEDRIQKYQLALSSVADFASLRPRFTTAEWNFRVRLLQPEKNYPGLLEIGVVEPELESPGGKAQSLKLLHVWVAPPSAFDGINPKFLSDETVLQAFQKVARSNSMAYIYERELATEIAGRPAKGFTLLMPCSSPTSEGTAAVGKNPSWNSAVFGSIEPNLLLSTLFGTAPREIDFDLFNGPDGQRVLLNTDHKKRGANTAGLRPYMKIAVPLKVQADEWVLEAYTTPLFEAESSRYQPWTVVISGTVLSGAIAGILFLQIRARLRQEAVAHELRLACNDLQRVQNERERLSRELHDGAIQSLYGLQLTLGRYERLVAKDPPSATNLLSSARSSVDMLIGELRSFLVQHLPEDEPRPASAGAALRELVRRYSNATSIAIILTVDEDPPLFPEQVLHLRQIAQEALSNCVRHARASRIQIQLSRPDGKARLAIRDDGVGFDTHSEHRLGQGMGNMQARAIQMGGKLWVESHNGKGTLVLLQIPITQDNPTQDG